MAMVGKKGTRRGSGISRRDFLRLTGTVTVGAGITGLSPRCLWLKEAVAALPVAEGYLLVDTKKCQGCLSCMLACSLVQEGRINPSLARIQILQDAFERFPHDVTMAQCRQCAEPECLKACPTGALHADSRKGNVRRVEATKCIGCKACIQACPFMPSRAIWNHREKNARTCDLCAGAPFWNGRGGPRGRQACIEVCPMGAITFSRRLPKQDGDEGYEVNLRGEDWKRLGLGTD